MIVTDEAGWGQWKSGRRQVAPMRVEGERVGWGGGGATGVSDRVVLSTPLWCALQGSPEACSVK